MQISVTGIAAALGFMLALASPASADETVSKKMAFEECQALTVRTIIEQDSGVQLTEVVRTDDTWETKLETPSRKISITCSRSDQEMVFVVTED